MKRSVFFASLTLVAIFMSCGAGSKSQSASDAVAVDSVAPGSYARISAPESIDMGPYIYRLCCLSVIVPLWKSLILQSLRKAMHVSLLPWICPNIFQARFINPFLSLPIV